MVLFVPFGNEWVGINVGNEVMSVGGADIVEFANDCAVTSAGRSMAERILNEYCMVLDSFRLLIIVNFVVKIWKQTTSLIYLRWERANRLSMRTGGGFMYCLFYCGYLRNVNLPYFDGGWYEVTIWGCECG